MNLNTICVSVYAACALGADHLATKTALLELMDKKAVIDATVLKLQQDVNRAEDVERLTLSSPWLACLMPGGPSQVRPHYMVCWMSTSWIVRDPKKLVMK